VALRWLNVPVAITLKTSAEELKPILLGRFAATIKRKNGAFFS
jgi:hypothetical protein